MTYIEKKIPKFEPFKKCNDFPAITYGINSETLFINIMKDSYSLYIC